MKHVHGEICIHKNCLDFSANCNPLGTPEDLEKQAVRDSLDHLKDYPQVKPEDIDRKAFESELYTAGLPDVDFLIRTSGEMRLSNFLLYQLAYAEFYQTDTLWPDFDRHAYDEALLAYAKRNRRFGGV